MAMDYNKPIFSATLGDLREVLMDVLTDLNNQQPTEPLSRPKQLVYGIAGIAKIFGCSQVTAQRIKSEGTIDPAVSQIGDIIVTDVDKALELTSIETQKRKSIGKRQRYVMSKK